MKYNIGINDADYAVTQYVFINGIKKKVKCPFYAKWSEMLARCYSPASLNRRKSYEDCTVCKDWHRFSTFKKWMESQDWEGKDLDKDLLGDGTLYSPETCCFIEKSINSFLTERDSMRGIYKIGVSYHKLTHKFQANCGNPFSGKKEYLGLYDSEEAAHLAWKKRKLDHALLFCKNISCDKIKRALISRYLTEVDNQGKVRTLEVLIMEVS